MIRLFVLVVVAAMTVPIQAQETRGSITGKISDPTGAIIPGAIVHAVNAETNVSAQSQSNASGTYEILFLLPGAYRVTAEAPGFKTFVREGIEVRTSDRMVVEVRLEVGTASEQITVTEETPLLEQGNASLGQVIDERRFADLPIAHGNPYMLMSLAGGVVYTENPGLDRPFEPTHSVGYSMGGVRSNSSEITMDGSPNTMLTRGGGGVLAAGYTPPSDLVREFRVQTNSFDASVGHSQGGSTSITLKSGGNQVHGTLYHSLMNPVLNGNLFFANKAGQERGHFIYNRWGGTMTGPLWLPGVYNGKNRTFFSYGYEGIHEARAMGAAYNEGVLTVPTAAQRSGDFSQLLQLGSNYQVYDPATKVRLANGRIQSNPFAGNVIPASRINPVSAKILSYWSLPNVPGSADGRNNLLRVNDPETIAYWNHVARLDHNIGSSHRVFFRGGLYKRLSSLRDWYRSPATGITSRWIPKSFAADDVWTITPTTIFNVRYSFYHLSIQQAPKDDSLNFDLASLGLPKSYVDQIPPDVRRFPYVTIEGYSGSQNNWYLWSYVSHALDASVTTVRGRHTIKIGGDARNFRGFQYEWNNVSSGYFAFSSAYTRGPLDNSTASPIGQGLASMLLGIASSGRVERRSDFAEQSTVWSAFVHDDFRAGSRLTLNLGVRYELEGPLSERYDRTVRGFDFTTPNPLEAQAKAIYAQRPMPEVPADKFRVLGGLTFAGVNGQPHTLWTRDKNNVMPRIGVAWTAARNTVVRAGYGVFYGSLGAQRVNVNQTGYNRSTTLVPTLDNGLSFVATMSNPFPNGILEPRGASAGLLTEAGNAVSYFPENPKASFQQRWQLAIQRLLPKRVLFEIAYVGNHGANLARTMDLRALPEQYLSRSATRDDVNYQFLTTTVPNPFYPQLAGTGLAGTTVNRYHLLAAGDRPQFTGVTAAAFDGYSNYHSGHVRAERRFAAGFTLNVVYGWSKFMEASTKPAGENAPFDYSISNYDRPQRVVVSGILELPFGRRKRFFASSGAVVQKLVGGWQVQGSYTGQSGPALGFGNAIYYGADIHDVTLPPDKRKPEAWFNTSGFERDSRRQPVYNYWVMSSRFNDIRGDGMNLWNLSALKNTMLTERFRLQFRGEYLNAFNHANFARPNTTVTGLDFGIVSSQAGYPRRVQVGLKILF